MRILHLILFLAVCSEVHAHQLQNDALKISRLWQSSSNYIKAIIDDTHSGYRVRCAFYDQQDKILAVQEQSTDELATELMIGSKTFRSEDIASYRCILK